MLSLIIEQRVLALRARWCRPIELLLSESAMQPISGTATNVVLGQRSALHALDSLSRDLELQLSSMSRDLLLSSV